MEINYADGVVTNKTVLFEGETDDGKFFTITANWNESDDWECDAVMWHDEEGTEEESQAIKEQFESDMN